ncbi:hypothetical protein AD05_4777 [Escherichia coli 5-366-08_S4_C2]|nr:hypothetical protein FORC31_3454 [Escherichia coli]EMV46903.1 hypothetical protein ECBCE019MS13_0794 [Escherichia coli BCE019_MS-13]EMV63795.1 hypothetical protein EC2872000_0876 [Escherichia coli 2872000]EMV64311.1 hypothetical protein EC2871950_0763 [Escherichia coli 2871950]EMX26561.1 hypothetical protein ECMP0215661_1002 [Escherichia coli MP021566.1]ENA35667.1 hypothetical protein ECBCE007MS11_0658 [Escherichia coli BCE007_MS-11]ENA83282.1 hypothetical protein EC2730450_0852 [Escherich
MPWWSTYQVLGKMILNIFTPQLEGMAKTQVMWLKEGIIKA